MIEFNEASINKFALHRISIEEGNSFLSDTVFETPNEEEEETLKRIFLKSFQTNTITYEFKHKVDIELNTLLKLSKSIYDGGNFLSKSKNIHQHLKAVSKHPNIKDGDLFIVKFDEIKMNSKFYEALGIYKIENKESFIETATNRKGEIGLSFRKGIGSKRLDKACLIVFTEQPFTVFIIDNNSTETDYWQNEFLKVGLRNDNVNNTTQFLTLAKTFVTQQLPSDFEVTKADQIDLLNRSVDYFKTHENFEKTEFEKEVFQDTGIIKSFRNFDSSYRQENEIAIADDFSISPQAVKKQARVFKSVLKLDKNFHIYIHGNRDLIEQGVEKDGRKFYKIYFDQES
jgi:37-kD nucleoid-associated bacterial protein